MIRIWNGHKNVAMAVWTVIAGAFLTPVACKACFSIAAGKNATVDGAVIIAHNEDDGAPQIVNHHKIPRIKHAPGEKVTLFRGGTLPQVEQTWAYIWSEMPGMHYSDSYVNEWGVTVTSDNCPSREDKPELTDGGIGLMLRRLVAQRARTAREGVLLAGRLVERFGYVDSGRTYVIGDPNEAWFCCVVNGKHWLAQRVPDGHVAMVANTYSIRQVSIGDEANVLACKDIVEYAKARGWYDPQRDGAFDFAAAYANPGSASHLSNQGRQWSGLSYVSRRRLQPGPNLPFSVVPRNKLSVTDMMRILRHDKEDGRPMPGNEPFVCSLCQGATQTSFVAQLRSTLPLDIGVVYWATLAPPRSSVYLPFHVGISQFPTGFCLESERPSAEAFDGRVNAPFAIEPFEPFWMFSNLRAKVVDNDRAIDKVRNQAERIERDAVAIQASIEEAARSLYETDEAAAVKVLENYSAGVYLAAMEAMNAMVVED